MVLADHNSSLIGQQIDRYRVVSLLGAGGMGEVYLAEDARLNRKVALKLLPAQLTADEQRLRRFKQEARAVSSLNHPNILTIHEIGQANGRHFIATELIEGESLRSQLKKSRLEIGAALDVAIQSASALAAAHAKGIVHRDIKPENIMVRDDGYIKVLDFGLAKLTDREAINSDASTWANTEPGVVVGTVQYMSPEQARGLPVDARTDIWSLGAVLYEMVSGRPPHEGETASDTIVSILEREPTRLTQLAAGVPAELERIVHKCLEKNPENRYQSAKEMQIDLRRLSSPSSAPAIVVPARQRRRWPLFAAIVPLLLLVVVFGVWLGRQLFQPAVPQLITTPLTSFVGWEMSASLSPDSKFVAYTHNPYGQMEIFVVPTTGGDPVRVTNTSADELTARWSPDGRYIAFASDRGTGTNIYAIPPLGGSERKIAETNIPWIGGELEAVSCLGPQPWSPGSTELVFTRMHPSGEQALWKISLQTGAETQLTHPAPGEVDNSASWSFDGKRIAFHRRRGKGQGSLWLMDVSGGNVEQVGSDGGGPAWLPDNQRLLFVSGRGGGRELWELDLKSRRTRQVTSGGGGAVLGSNVSANGKIAFVRYSHQVDIYWGEVGQPHEQHQRLTAHTFNNFGARVSPDGQKVLYFSDRTGNYDLWLLDRRGGSERQLTDHTGGDLMGDWSPDGKQIVFLSSREGSLQPWVIEVDTGRTRRVSERSHTVTFEPHFSGPRWSPDGQAIGFIASSDKEETLVIIDPNGGNERSPLPRVNTFDWWRDSGHVIYMTKADDAVMEMRAADLETGKSVVLLRGPTAEMVVARDGSAVAYLHSVSHFAMQVIVQRLAPGPDGLPRPLGPMKQLTNGGGEWHVHMGGWSPDGKAVVYTRDADSGDVYMIQNYQ